MTNKPISITGLVGNDYFYLKYLRRSIYKLEHFLTFDKDEYYIFKLTNKQRQVSFEDFLEFKFSGYIFFKKDLYDLEHMNLWIDWSIETFKGHGFNYLNKPFPPFNTNIIKIKK